MSSSLSILRDREYSFLTAELKPSITLYSGNNSDYKFFNFGNGEYGISPYAGRLIYWIKNFTSGIDDERAVSSSFLASSEFKERYGENISHGTYVENLYLNFLNRELYQCGYDYWVGNLNNGAEERHEVLLVSQCQLRTNYCLLK
tara:strand:+ start:78 stop:512 length:435 start_codon:yes stop_codon:yes gene_type:complete